MNDQDWIGRLVEFRGPKTLGESYLGEGWRQHNRLCQNDQSAKVYQGRIRSVFRKEDGRLYATAELLYVSSISVRYFQTNPDPNWTSAQYDRRKHHRSQFRAVHGSKILWHPTRGELLIRYKGPKWKPVKL
jgi:hypothetical protein